MISIGRPVSVAQDTALLPSPMAMGSNGDLLKIWHLVRRYWSWCLIGTVAGLGVGNHVLAAENALLHLPGANPRGQKRQPHAVATRDHRRRKTNMSEDLLSTHVQLISSPSVVGNALATLDKRILQEIDGLKGSKETAVTYVVKQLREQGGRGSAKRRAYYFALVCPPERRRRSHHRGGDHRQLPIVPARNLRGRE